jgi:hypothetical protein
MVPLGQWKKTRSPICKVGPRLMCVSGTRLKDTLENADAKTLRALLLNPQDLATVGGAWVSSAVHRGSAASAFSGAGRVATKTAIRLRWLFVVFLLSSGCESTFSGEETTSGEEPTSDAPDPEISLSEPTEWARSKSSGMYLAPRGAAWFPLTPLVRRFAPFCWTWSVFNDHSG